MKIKRAWFPQKPLLDGRLTVRWHGWRVAREWPWVVLLHSRMKDNGLLWASLFLGPVEVEWWEVAA